MLGIDTAFSELRSGEDSAYRPPGLFSLLLRNGQSTTTKISLCLDAASSSSTPSSLAPPALFQVNPYLHPIASTLPRALLKCMPSALQGSPTRCNRLAKAFQISVVFDTYIEVLSSFVPLIISFSSLPPITICLVLCRTRDSTIPQVMLGSVEALQKKAVYPFRDRVGELCSLLFLRFHSHLFQVCYSHRVLNTALNISSSRTVSSSYNTQYAQPRSSPSRTMLNQSFYTQWPP